MKTPKLLIEPGYVVLDGTPQTRISWECSECGDGSRAQLIVPASSAVPGMHYVGDCEGGHRYRAAYPHPPPEAITATTQKLLDQTKLLGFDVLWEPESHHDLLSGDPVGMWHLAIDQERPTEQADLLGGLGTQLQEIGWRHDWNRAQIVLYGDRELLDGWEHGSFDALASLWKLGQEDRKPVLVSSHKRAEVWGEVLP